MTRRNKAEYDQKLVEEIAQVIHRSTLTDTECEAMGCRRKVWKTDAPWDTDPEELTEWERDDFRRKARAVIDLLVLKRLLD